MPLHDSSKLAITSKALTSKQIKLHSLYVLSYSVYSILLELGQAKQHFAFEFYPSRTCQLKLTPPAL